MSTTNTPALIVNRYTDSCPTHYSTLHCLTLTLCFYATVTTVTQVLTTTRVIAVYTKSDSSANKTRIQKNEHNEGLAWLILGCSMPLAAYCGPNSPLAQAIGSH